MNQSDKLYIDYLCLLCTKTSKTKGVVKLEKSALRDLCMLIRAIRWEDTRTIYFVVPELQSTLGQVKFGEISLQGFNAMNRVLNYDNLSGPSRDFFLSLTRLLYHVEWCKDIKVAVEMAAKARGAL